jgi:hypothetical protein
MNITRKLRFQLLVQNGFFVVLFLLLMILLGYLASQYHYAKDITQANRNFITQGSVNVLNQMKDPINITVYATKDNVATDDNFRKSMVEFIKRYQDKKKDINLKFINQALEPKLVQEAGVKEDGEVVVEYNKRSEHILPPISEQDMTNLLVRLSRTSQQAIMYLDAHGERNLLGIKNHDLGEFGKQLEVKGFKFANPDLLVAQGVPTNGAMLVIASPQVDISDAEVKKIKTYLDGGGNLLWLLDDDNLHGLKEIADYIGLQVSHGMVVDPTSGQFANVFGSVYGAHAITMNFTMPTGFHEAHQVTAQGTDENGWKVSNLVEVARNGWLTADKVTGGELPDFNPDKDKRGPINIGVALERTYGKKGQRIVVMGNGNFLSNTFIANYGNLDFGVNIVNWLAGDDNLITIQPMPLKDVNVTIPDSTTGVAIAWTVFHAFQWFLPIGMMIAGFVFWWKRRKA